MSDFDFTELARLEVVLDQASERAERMTRLAVKKTGLDVVTGAQALVPVDTGNLKNSIGVDFDADELGFTAEATANYAAYVELGTSRMAPQPYLGPAFDRATASFVKAIESIGGRVLE
ncbi:HK97 gp10 family phage protein [Streptosporangium sp. NBC_01755]|uniref:HK97-gp10 family putative phage morphogenesis protein n=1 Tax=Streptosporangium sp. NBC_01755 TaxID=2975949 RepID=UPI002DD989A2|nr:HK97-gp10 family putative phage morphogenesis protein [Streptosporangium sp. NBC_01755]WSD03862.1 HK97 gp10 family phage protein [Streptosporangium sp. NBC_01755]